MDVESAVYISRTKHQWTDVGKIQHPVESGVYLAVIVSYCLPSLFPHFFGAMLNHRLWCGIFSRFRPPRPPVAKDYRSGLPLTPLLKDLSSSSTVGSIKRSSWCRLENHFPSRNWRGVEETLSAIVERIIKFLVTLVKGTSYKQRKQSEVCTGFLSIYIY